MAAPGNYISRPQGPALLVLSRHAHDGMAAERPRVRHEDLARVLEEPDHDDGTTAWKRIGRRTVIVRYVEEEGVVRVRSVSATRRALDA